MSDTVFIFGAGASAEAGGPLMEGFLDRARDLVRRRVIESGEDLGIVSKAIDQLQRTSAKSSINIYNLESVWGALEMAEIVGSLGDLTEQEVKHARDALRRVIVQTIEASLAFPVVRGSEGRGHVALGPTGYHHLAAAIRGAQEKRGSRSVAILTFNYDIGIEYALANHGIAVDSGFGQHAENAVSVCKLHGSLNWTLANQTGRVLVAPIPTSQDFMHLDAVGPDLRIHMGQRLLETARKYDGDGKPLIVPPTDSKMADRRVLSQVWRRAAEHLREASRIAVVGFSLPPTDEFFRNFFGVGSVSGTVLEHFAVVDKSGEAADRIKKLLSSNVGSRFEFRQGKFTEHIAFLESMLR